MAEWTDWSGSVRFSPARIECPETEDEVVLLVQRAAEQGRTVRMVGAGHLSSRLLPFEPYFSHIEPIFRAYGGRPHWGKKHNLSAEDLRPLYPKWDEFAAIRCRLDPDGVFLSPSQRRLLL
jgi:FAD/FMN-containing dehydrogenase